MTDDTTPERELSDLKPFQNLPPDCTHFEDDSEKLRRELAQAIPEMLQYHESHPSTEPAYKNCRDELTEIQKLAIPKTPSARRLQAKPPVYLVTRHDDKIQGLAIVTRLHDSIMIDHASLAPWNIVPPPVSEASAPNPFKGGGWQMVSVALNELGQVDLTPATEQAVQSFSKMGFRNRDGKELTVDAAGTLKGTWADDFKKKMAAFGPK